MIDSARLYVGMTMLKNGSLIIQRSQFFNHSLEGEVFQRVGLTVVHSLPSKLGIPQKPDHGGINRFAIAEIHNTCMNTILDKLRRHAGKRKHGWHSAGECLNIRLAECLAYCIHRCVDVYVETFVERTTVFLEMN